MRTGKLVITSALLLSALAGFSQTKREILEEDPKLAPNLRFDLSPMHMMTDEMYDFIGYSVKASYRHNNKFTIAGEFRKEWVDYEEEQLKAVDGRYGKYHTEPYKGYGIELTGTYYFKVIDKAKEEYLPIKSRSVGYRTVEVTVDPIDVSRLNMFGVRGGYSTYKATMYAVANISEVGNPSNVLLGEDVMPLQTRGYVFGGLSFTRIKNIKVSYPGYGKRRKQFIKEVYLDVLYKTSAKSENVVDYYGVAPVTYQIDELVDEKEIGFRLGVYSTPTGRLLNLGYGLEIARMPGNGLFGFNFKLALGLGTKVGSNRE